MSVAEPPSSGMGGLQEDGPSIDKNHQKQDFSGNLDVLIDFSLTVKAATLMFISGCGLAISSAKQGKSGSIYNLVKNFKISCLGRANVRVFHENPNRIHTELIFINP